MRCDPVRAALLDFSNGEIAPVRAWAIRRHLAACADCAEELASLRHFKAALRRADPVPPQNALAPVPPRWILLRRTTAVAMAALLAGGVLLLPALYQSRRTTQNPGAAIAAALARVNTWHFSGWKLIDGKQVPWDVWGRRTPWLYYERVGDMITWSDGKQRVRVFAPNPALNRPEGLEIKTSADQAYFDLGFSDDPAYQTLVSSQQARTDFGDGFTKLYAQTLAVAKFRRQYPIGVSSGVNANKLYTISKRDWLPTTYQLHFDSARFARDTEYLGVHYDVDLPNTILTPPATDGYGVVDFTPSGKHTVGFRISAEPVGLDTAGNVVILARGWLGKDRLTPNSAFSLNVQPYNGRFSGERGGQSVKYLYATNSSLPPGSDILMPFAPLEPSEVASGPPDTFLLSLSASPEIQVRSSDLIYSDGSTHPVTRPETLISEHFHWRMPLPLPDVHLKNSFPSPYDLAEQRRTYYFVGSDYQYTALKQAAPQLVQAGAMNPDGTVGRMNANGAISINMKMVNAVEAVQKRHPDIFKKAEREFRERAIYWQQRKLSLLPRGGATHDERYDNQLNHAEDVELLAECYQRADDKANCVRTLRQLIRECQAMPQRGGSIRRQAEYALRTGQFPGAADYKGPD